MSCFKETVRVVCDWSFLFVLSSLADNKFSLLSTSRSHPLRHVLFFFSAFCMKFELEFAVVAGDF